ncbi:MAG: hypothetical protein ACJ736_15540 [Streptomyces sp.]
MPPENVQAGRAPDLDPVVLEVGLEGAVVRHDYDKMRVPFVDGLAEGGEVGPCRGPPAVVGGGQVQQQLVTAFDQSRVVEGQFAFLAGQKLVKDAAVVSVFTQEYPGGGRTAAARRAVQNDAAGGSEQGAGLAHAGRGDQHTSQPNELIFSDAPKGRLVRVLQMSTDVDVDVTESGVHETLWVLNARTAALLAHRLSSS